MSKLFSSRSRVVWDAILVLAVTVLLFSFTEDAEESVRKSLDLCARILIPSLFPFMVISALYVRLGIAEVLCRPFSSVLRLFFRLPECAGSAIFLGAVCGFPVGAKTACDLYLKGDLTKEEAECLIAAANNTGPSFVVEVIGAYYWNSRGFGLFLYLVQILSALLISHIASFKRSVTVSGQCAKSHGKDSLGRCFAEAVSSSASGVLGICGFVAFFSAVLAVLRRLLSTIGLESALPYMASVLEFSTGCSEAALTGGIPGAFLTGFCVGWSGFSVFAQCSLFTGPAGLSLRFTAACKAIQGLLCGVFSVFWCILFDLTPSVHCSVFPQQPFPFQILIAEILLLFLFCFIPFFYTAERKLSRNPSDAD